MELTSNVIVKQEIFVNDLDQQDYEHLLQEFYHDDPPEENPIEKGCAGQVKDEVLDPKEGASSILEEPVPLKSESFDELLETFDEEIAHPGYVEDNDHYSFVIVKEEFLKGEHDELDVEASLGDVLPSSVEIISNQLSMSSGVKRSAPQIKRPEWAQKCPMCKTWTYHTTAGLQNRLQKRYEKQLAKSIPIDITSTLCLRSGGSVGSRQCPVCRQRFLNRTTEDSKIDAQDRQKTVKQAVVRQKEIKKPRILKSKLIVNNTRKVGRPKGSRKCAKPRVKVVTQKSKVVRQKLSKSFVKLGRFSCTLCGMSFASKREQIIHEQNGHKVQQLMKLPQIDAIFVQKKGTRKRKPRGKIGRYRRNRKCPMCQVRSQSKAMFKDHLQSHIQV